MKKHWLLILILLWLAWEIRQVVVGNYWNVILDLLIFGFSFLVGRIAYYFR